MKSIKIVIRILIFAFLGIIVFGSPHLGQAVQGEMAQADIYEPNDTCEESTTIQPDGTVQSHNFHDEGDIDWFTFTAPTSGTYRIEVDIPNNSPADVDLHSYTKCNSLPDDQWTESFAPGARLDVDIDSAGQQLYIQLENYDPLRAGVDVSYGLSIRQISSGSDMLAPGPVIIVAGRYRAGDSFQVNIDRVAMDFYNFFKAKGHQDSEIYFLATDSALTGYDAPATLRNLQRGIVDWAKEGLEREDVSKVLTLYLVSHGDRGMLYLDKTNEEILFPDDLDQWLSILEEDIPGLQVSVIIEACHSGSFIELPDSISKLGRVVVTSTSTESDTYVSRHGINFSDVFITLLRQEFDLATSFNRARENVRNFYTTQRPWLDANGNGVPNEIEDIALASVRNIATFTPSATPNGADGYEPDNNCANTYNIEPNGIPQRHTFHQANDQDWTTFTAHTAGTYRIEATIPDGSSADLDLYYYTECDTFHEDKFVETFTAGARLDIEADSPGQQFYIKLKNYDPLQFGPNVSYALSVHQLTQEQDQEGNPIAPGPAIVVAGRYQTGDPLQRNIDQTALAAYELLANTGRYDSDIFFLATDSSLPNFDGEATQYNLKHGITTWAKKRLEKENVSQVLTLYLVDHGGPDKFYLDRFNEEVLTSNDLHLWLTELEESFPNLLVNVVIEACKAGSFIDPIDGSISKPGRVIITSSNSTYDAYASLYGARFSENFISFLGQEKNLGYSFYESSEIVQKFYKKQQPWIDADGNSIPNELSDISAASLRSIANWNFGAGWPPYIAQVMTDRADDGMRLQAEVRHEHGKASIKAVWGVVYPPDYIHPTGDADHTDEGQLNGPELEIIEFAADASTNTLFVSTEGAQFTKPGRYQVAIHAQDLNGLEARPVIVDIEIPHAIYMPIIQR